MARLKRGKTVYQVKADSGHPILYKGVVVLYNAPNVGRIMWLAPDAEFKGCTTREYPCDLYLSPRRAILAYLRRVKRNLEIQQDELEA